MNNFLKSLKYYFCQTIFIFVKLFLFLSNYFYLNDVMMLLEKSSTKQAAQSAKKQTSRFSLWAILGVVIFFGLLAYFIFSFGETTESEKLRFQVLKNKCLRGETLEAEEANEFCTLSRQFEPNLLFSQDCSVFFRTYYQAHLSDFLNKSEGCAEDIAAGLQNKGFQTQIDTADNRKGLNLIVLKNERMLLRIRLMHRSSGAKKFRNDHEYFRINLVQQGSFFVDKMGNPSQNPEDTHLIFSNCVDVENLIYNAINKHIK